MIGPSSSHTAGAIRLGKIARELLGQQPVKALIKLHGSFAKTYRGHGTDKAIIGGLLGYSTDDPEIRTCIDFAKQKGLKYLFQTVKLKNVHPNSAVIHVEGKSGSAVSILGSSTGGGRVVIKRVNNFNVDFTAEFYTMIIPHKDTPGVVASVTNILAYYGINIANMKVYRCHRGIDAMMIIETDQQMNDGIVNSINRTDSILDIKIIEPV